MDDRIQIIDLLSNCSNNNCKRQGDQPDIAELIEYVPIPIKRLRPIRAEESQSFIHCLKAKYFNNLGNAFAGGPYFGNAQ